MTAPHVLPWLCGAALTLAACASPTVSTPTTRTQDADPAAGTTPATGAPPFSPEAFLGPVPGLGAEDQAIHARTGKRVALLLPLSGPQSTTGQDLLDAAQMALFDLAGEDFVLLLHDTRGTTEGAAVAAEEALDEGASLIVGPLLASSVAAVAPEARRRDVPVLAFSNNRAVAGDGVFVMGFLPHAQVDRVVAYARSQGLTRFAALAPNDVYGTTMVDALEQATTASASIIEDVALYDPGSAQVQDVVRRFADYDARRQALLTQQQALEGRNDPISRQALARLEGRETLGEPGFDAVLVPAGGDEVLQLAPLMAFYDIDPGRVRLLGTWLWDDPALGKEPSLVGAWFAAPPPQNREQFVTRFEEAYGHAPDRRATLAYDAIALAAVLARQTGAEAPFGIQNLTTPNGFEGMDGIFRLLPTGEVERGLAVLEIRRDGPRELDPAPDSFTVAIN
ncbi:MAG: penicillin-binding protein activator [Alphaproteobacteria bacterium]